MTKNECRLIANTLTQRRLQIFREGFNPDDRNAIFKTLNDVIIDFADYLAADNPKFNRDEFLKDSNYTGVNYDTRH